MLGSATRGITPRPHMSKKIPISLILPRKIVLYLVKRAVEVQVGVNDEKQGNERNCDEHHWFYQNDYTLSSLFLFT